MDRISEKLRKLNTNADCRKLLCFVCFVSFFKQLRDKTCISKDAADKSLTAGFTLIELLVYISISSVVLLIASAFFISLLRSQVKNQVVNEVEDQGREVLQVITQAVRNAQSINSPLPGTSSSTLSLGVSDATKNPTIFDLQEGRVRIKEGEGNAVFLTNSRIVVSGLLFQNITKPGSAGAVRISFTISHINPEGRQEYNYQKEFISAASLRK